MPIWATLARETSGPCAVKLGNTGCNCLESRIVVGSEDIGARAVNKAGQYLSPLLSGTR
jgi:hypothetical protein